MASAASRCLARRGDAPGDVRLLYETTLTRWASAVALGNWLVRTLAARASRWKAALHDAAFPRSTSCSRASATPTARSAPRAAPAEAEQADRMGPRSALGDLGIVQTQPSTVRAPCATQRAKETGSRGCGVPHPRCGATGHTARGRAPLRSPRRAVRPRRAPRASEPSAIAGSTIRPSPCLAFRADASVSAGRRQSRHRGASPRTRATAWAFAASSRGPCPTACVPRSPGEHVADCLPVPSTPRSRPAASAP
jgi:hypothetical protein